MRLSTDPRTKAYAARLTTAGLDTGEIIATNRIDPDHSYWRNIQKVPDRWPGTSHK